MISPSSTFLHPTGTPFQLEVWEALTSIPYGEVRSYGQVAEQLGRPGASRAVGLANGRNLIAVIVPCHRVIGASGSLTGYGGGLHCKRLLLDLEAVDGRTLITVSSRVTEPQPGWSELETETMTVEVVAEEGDDGLARHVGPSGLDRMAGVWDHEEPDARRACLFLPGELDRC